MMPTQIIPIKAFNDNYIWALVSPGRSVWVVDPGDAEPVLRFLEKHNFLLAGVLITHHHWDHCGGVKKLIEHFPVPIYGPAHSDISASHVVHEGDKVLLPDSDLVFEVMEIPGHTLDHIAYYCADENFIFCGDTLFSAGCGRLFEGTPEQMFYSLNRIYHLPDSTKIYCAHEYTAANLKFAHVVEPNNADIIKRMKEVAELRQQGLPTLPSELLLEKATNPFLRCHFAQVQQAASEHVGKILGGSVEVFAAIRSWKDNFKVSIF